jgi:hypothetical protein
MRYLFRRDERACKTGAALAENLGYPDEEFKNNQNNRVEHLMPITRNKCPAMSAAFTES